MHYDFKNLKLTNLYVSIPAHLLPMMYGKNKFFFLGFDSFEENKFSDKILICMTYKKTRVEVIKLHKNCAAARMLLP